MKGRKKVFGIGCTHGEYIHPGFANAVLSFREAFKPHKTIHLGDAFDTQAFRSGAAGTADETHDLRPDIDDGKTFLRALAPDVFIEGNHEFRLTKMCSDPRTIVRECARSIRSDMYSVLGPNCAFVNYNTFDGYELGGYLWLHGIMFGQNYLRDSAETFGNCVVAHAHVPGVASGRVRKCATAYGVGTGCRIEDMQYAATRRNTLAWAHGMIYGWYNDNSSHLNLHIWPRGEKTWNLPSF